MSFFSTNKDLDIISLSKTTTNIDKNTIISFINIPNEGSYNFRINTKSPSYLLYFSFYDQPLLNTIYESPVVNPLVYLKKGIYLMYAKALDTFTVEYSTDAKTWNNISTLLVKDNSLHYFIQNKLSECSKNLENYESETCQTTLSSLKHYIQNFNFLNTPLANVDKTYSNWGEYEGCLKKCGKDSKTRIKTYIPSLYDGVDIVNQLPVSENVECNSFCKTDSDVYNFWKEKTKCTTNSLPSSTTSKVIKYLDETNKEISVDSPFYIDNLKYAENDEDLYNLIKQWDAPTSVNPSIECFNSKILANTSIKKGSYIYSSSGSSYLLYGTDGKLSFQVIDEKGVFVTIWKPDVAINSDLCALVDSKLVLYLNSKIVWSLDFGAPEISLYIDSTRIIVYSKVSYIVTTIGDPLFGLNVGDKILKSNNDIKILDGDNPTSYYLVFTKEGYLNLVDNTANKIIWQAGSDSNIKGGISGNLLEINSDNLCIKLNNNIVYKLDCNNLSKLTVNSVGRIEFFDSNEYLIRYIGNPISSLTTSYIIKKPLNLDIQKGVRIYSPSGSFYLDYQVDGNLVLNSKDGIQKWSSGTVGKKSDRLVLQEDGNLVIYDGTNTVWNSNSNILIKDSPTLFLFDSGYLVFMDGNSKIYKVLPECSNDILKTYLEDMWTSGTPAYIGVPFNSLNPAQIIGLDDVLESLNFDLCPPTELTCSLPFANIQSNTKLVGTVQLDYTSTYWSNAKYYLTKDLSKGTGLDINKNLSRSSISHYTNNDLSKIQVLGYRPMSNIYGVKSNPVVIITNKGLDIEYLYLFIKKDKDDFITDLLKNVNIINLMKNNKVLVDKYLLKYLYLDGVEPFGAHSSFSLNSVSSFENKDQPFLSEIYNNYLNEMYTYCEGGNILSQTCLDFLKDKEIDEDIKKKFYNFNISTQCKLQDNIYNKECIDYMNIDESTKKYVNSFCKNHIFNNNCKQLCGKQFTDDIDFNNIFCNANNTYLLLFLFIILIIVALIFVQKIWKKNKELENTL